MPEEEPHDLATGVAAGSRYCCADHANDYTQ
jgi:hypothetical protein